MRGSKPSALRSRSRKPAVSAGALLSLFALATLSGADLADLPDPLVGTDSKYELSHGNTYPAIFIPYATANWTPQTGDGGWQYQYFKDNIRGFRLTHLPSAWTVDWGSFSIMPVTGKLEVLPDKRGSKFRHEDETARAYRYSVLLQDYKTRVDMAPTRHGGVLRFTFPKTDDAYVVIDGNPGGSSVQIDPKTNTITGANSKTAKGTASNFALYFVALFDHPIKSYGTWDPHTTDTSVQRSGPHVGAYAAFSTREGEAVTVRIGTSLISLEQARLNLTREIGGADLDKVTAIAKAEWERELHKIEISGGTDDQRRTFYTAMYHSLQFPRMLDEVDAKGAQVHYSPYDGRVHPGPMMSDVGFWDVFRAQFPLLTVVHPKKDAEIIRALVNIYEEGGWLPTWPDPVETNVMIGTHADSVIADAYMKGIRDFDAQTAYAAIRKDGTEKGTGIFAARRGIEYYLKLGYVPADKVNESAASTLEYAYDDFCIAQMARALGKQDDYRMFIEHSKNYRNLWDPSTGFMRGKNADGSWVTPFDPLDWGGAFTEGNAWQWLWSVQHDVAGLMELMGGREVFIKRLDTLFSMTTDFKVGGYKELIHEMTEAKMGNMGQYAHINEPVHHVIYLYDYAGQPWKAQYWVHQVMDRNYKPGPAGWLGDEDNGQMSAWYIMTAMGFYAPNPGQPVYALGSPLFDRATIHLENGKTFNIEAARHDPADVYVQSATLNGKALDRVWIKHGEIENGGVLRFVLGPKANEKWGIGGIPAATVTEPRP